MKWPVTNISTLCVPTGQRDPTATPDACFRYIDIASVDKDAKRITNAIEVRGAEAPSRARKEVRAGDVLVSTVRPNLNAVARVPDDLHGQIASTGFCVLRANRKLSDGKFLFYRCLTPEFINFLVSQMRGANYPAVSDGVVKRADIPCPALKEQNRIAELLEQADRLRQQRNEVDEMTARIQPTLLHKMFGDPNTNSKGWPKQTLGSTGAAVRYGLGQPPQSSDRGLPLIRATNIHRGVITADDMIYVRREDVPESRNAFLKAEEVIVVRSGAYTGDIAQVTEKWAGSVAGYDLVVSPGEKFTGEFLESYLLTPLIQQNYFGNIKARAGQPHLNADQVLDTPMMVPPRPLQEQFSRFVGTLRHQQVKRSESGKYLNRLFSTMLHRAFTGELTAKWREAHLKELLVEMEHQAKLLRTAAETN